MLAKPSVAKYKYTLNINETSKQLAVAPGREVIAVIVSAGGGSAAVRVYDSADGVNEASPHKDSFLVTANAGESSSFTPSQPVPMSKGLYIELEQGASFNGEAFILYN